jgi:hypothetical protein
MRSTLLLDDGPETVRLMLKEVTLSDLAVGKREARAGCNCDRWGHPCPECINYPIVPEAETSLSSPVNQ